jgi:hypothetical protein
MEESDDCGVDKRDVDDDQSDGSNVVGKDDWKVDIPRFLVPFLDKI